MFLSYDPARQCQEKSPSRVTLADCKMDARFWPVWPPKSARWKSAALVDYFAVAPCPGDARMNPKPTLMAELIAEFLGTFVLMLLWHRRSRHGRAVPLEPPGRNHSRRIHQHHSGLGTRRHHGHLRCRQNFRSASQSGRDPRARRFSRIPLGQRFCRTPSLRRQGHSWPPRLWSTGIIFQRFIRSIRNSITPPASSPHFRPSRQLPQAGFLDQFIGTALLLLLIFAITDEFNAPPGANLAPVMIGLVVVAIGMSFGGMHGYAINPARDFGPRLFTVAAGFRNNGLTDGTHVWWVPVVAPLLGGLAGAALYDFGIRRFLRPS